MKLPVLNLLRAYSLGLHVGDSSVEWALSALTFRGRAIIASGEAPCDGKPRDQVLNELIGRLKGEYGHGIAVAVGMPAGLTFYATVPQTVHQENPASVLARHASLNAIAGDNLAADLLIIKVRGRALAAIAGCRKQTVQAIMSAIESHHLRLARVEPGPWSLLRGSQAEQRGRFSSVLKGTVLGVRVYLRGRHVLAVLCSERTPLLWRATTLPAQADEEAMEQQLASTIRSIGLHVRQHISDAALDEVVLESVPPIAGLTDNLAVNLGTAVRAGETGGPLGEVISRELSLSARREAMATLDLAKPLRPPPSLWAMVPRGEAAVLIALIVLMGLWLSFRGLSLTQRAQQLESANQRDPVLVAQTDAKLKQEQKRLTMEIAAVSGFLNSRTQWAGLFNPLAARMPDNTVLTEFLGEQPVRTAKKSDAVKGKHEILMGFATRYPDGGPVPPQIPELVGAVAGMEAITRHYPVVDLVGLQAGMRKGKNDTMVVAEYSILCLPKDGKKK